MNVDTDLTKHCLKDRWSPVLNLRDERQELEARLAKYESFAKIAAALQVPCEVGPFPQHAEDDDARSFVTVSSLTDVTYRQFSFIDYWHHPADCKGSSDHAKEEKKRNRITEIVRFVRDIFVSKWNRVHPA